MANDVVKTNQDKEIVPFNLGGALSEEELIAYKEEMDGLNAPMFKRVKCPSGGVVFFEVPTEDPDNPKSEKDITGVILHHHPINRYYSTPAGEGEEGQPPDCISLDGKVGVGDPGGACSSCPLNEFGSGRGGSGKACSNRHAIYVLENGELLPTLIEAPPTSLRPLGTYVSNMLLLKKTKTTGVVTKISVKKNKNANGQDFSLLQFGYVGKLDQEGTVNAMAYGQRVRNQVKENAEHMRESGGGSIDITECDDAPNPDEVFTK